MIISADKNKYSPPERRVIEGLNVDVPLVLVTRLDDFEFNPELENLDKYVLADMCEYGWNASFENTHFFGFGEHSFFSLNRFVQFDNSRKEWDKFNDFVARKQPLLYFKRELLKKDADEYYLPIDYPFYETIPPIQTKEEYYARPLNVFHYWGRSSEYRVKAHADFWRNSSKNGAAICDNIHFILHFLEQESSLNKWVSLNIPHYVRTDLSTLLHFNGISKIGLSMSGCGKKCFRSSEVCVNSLMMMEAESANDFAWQFPWDVSNCLLYHDNDPAIWIDNALTTGGDYLYNTYCRGVENAKNYQIDNYTKHLEGLIRKACE